MKRWWLVIALMLSVGINVGILATIAFQARPAVSETAADSKGLDGTTQGGTTQDGTTQGGDTLDGSEERPPSSERVSPPVIQRMANELGLEGDRRAAFIGAQQTFFEHTLSARSRMARLQREIRREVTSADPDREALDRLLVQLSAAHTDLERAFVTNLLDSRQLLDRDQERRFMHFLRRMRQVRGDVERRFRERWRGMGESRERLGPGGRSRAGGQRFGRPPGRPSATAPSATAPSATAPSATAPSATAPSATAPSAAEPASPPPGR